MELSGWKGVIQRAAHRAPAAREHSRRQEEAEESQGEIKNNL